MPSDGEQTHEVDMDWLSDTAEGWQEKTDLAAGCRPDAATSQRWQAALGGMAEDCKAGKDKAWEEWLEQRAESYELLELIKNEQEIADYYYYKCAKNHLRGTGNSDEHYYTGEGALIREHILIPLLKAPADERILNETEAQTLTDEICDTFGVPRVPVSINHRLKGGAWYINRGPHEGWAIEYSPAHKYFPRLKRKLEPRYVDGIFRFIVLHEVVHHLLENTPYVPNNHGAEFATLSGALYVHYKEFSREQVESCFAEQGIRYNARRFAELLDGRTGSRAAGSTGAEAAGDTDTSSHPATIHA